MKQLSFILILLSISVVTTACINNFAIQELNNKAKNYITSGDNEAAICRLKSSLELDNTIFETHYNLGLAYLSDKKYGEAISEFEEAIKLRSDYAEGYFSLAVAQEELAESMLEWESETKTKEYTEADKNLLITKLESAVENYNKYLTIKKNPSDIEDVTDRIKSLTEDIEEYKNMPPAKLFAED